MPTAQTPHSTTAANLIAAIYAAFAPDDTSANQAAVNTNAEAEAKEAIERIALATGWFYNVITPTIDPKNFDDPQHIAYLLTSDFLKLITTYILNDTAAGDDDGDDSDDDIPRQTS